MNIKRIAIASFTTVALSASAFAMYATTDVNESSIFFNCNLHGNKVCGTTPNTLGYITTPGGGEGYWLEPNAEMPTGTELMSGPYYLMPAGSTPLTNAQANEYK